jgi:hypothetical protein
MDTLLLSIFNQSLIAWNATPANVQAAQRAQWQALFDWIGAFDAKIGSKLGLPAFPGLIPIVSIAPVPVVPA